MTRDPRWKSYLQPVSKHPVGVKTHIMYNEIDTLITSTEQGSSLILQVIGPRYLKSALEQDSSTVISTGP